MFRRSENQISGPDLELRADRSANILYGGHDHVDRSDDSSPRQPQVSLSEE